MNRKIALIAGGLVVVLLAAWYLALWSPATTHLKAARAATSAAAAKQHQLGAELAGLLALERNLPASEAQLRRADVALPTAPAVDRVIDQIDAIAIADRITWTNESQTLATAATGPSAATSADSEAVLDLSLDVQGPYNDMSRFVTDLEHRPRLIVVDSLTYTPERASRVSLTINARAFYDTTPIPELPKVVGQP